MNFVRGLSAKARVLAAMIGPLNPGKSLNLNSHRFSNESLLRSKPTMPTGPRGAEFLRGLAWTVLFGLERKPALVERCIRSDKIQKWAEPIPRQAT